MLFTEDQKNLRAELYWIHLKGVHTDPFSEGYIGITTTTTEKRFQNHWNFYKTIINETGSLKRNGIILYKAFKKYGQEDIGVKTLVVGHLEGISDLENKLRSKQRIGWNTAVGGNFSPSLGGHTQETINKLSSLAKERMSDPLRKEAQSRAMKKYYSGGGVHPMTGYEWSEETLRLCSQSQRKWVYYTPYGCFDSGVIINELFDVPRSTLSYKCSSNKHPRWCQIKKEDLIFIGESK